MRHLSAQGVQGAWPLRLPARPAVDARSLLQAAISASEHLGVPLELFFSQGEDPLHIHCLRDDLQAEWVIATTEGERPPEAGAMGPPAAPAAAGSAAPGNSVPSAAARAASQRPVPPQQQADSVSGSNVNGAAAPSASISRSMPGASAARPSSPARRQPMESTPLPHARPAQELPLFRGTQGSHDGDEQRSDDEMAAAVAAADGEEAEEDEWAVVEALEQSISRGEVEIHGSQVVPSASQRPPTQPAGARAAPLPSTAPVTQARAASIEPRPTTQARAASPPSRPLYVSSGVSQAPAQRKAPSQQQQQQQQQLSRLAEESVSQSSSSLGIEVSQVDFAEHARRRSSIRRDNERAENRSVEPPEHGGAAQATVAPPQRAEAAQEQRAWQKVSLAWRSSQAAAGALSQALVEEQPPPASWRDALHAAGPLDDESDEEGDELPASDEEEEARMGGAAKRVSWPPCLCMPSLLVRRADV